MIWIFLCTTTVACFQCFDRMVQVTDGIVVLGKVGT